MLTVLWFECIKPVSNLNEFNWCTFVVGLPMNNGFINCCNFAHDTLSVITISFVMCYGLFLKIRNDDELGIGDHAGKSKSEDECDCELDL